MMHPDETRIGSEAALVLPENSLLLGMGMDGLPLVLDLSDWGPGSFLVVADGDQFIGRVFQMVGDSAEMNNSTYELCIHLIASGFDVESGLLRSRVGIDDPAGTALVDEMFGILKQREDGRLRLPHHLLLIEDWVAFARAFSPEALGRLMTLVAHGPFWGMWVMAGMRSGQLHQELYEQVERFPSRVLGRIADVSLARYFSGLPLVNLKGLKPNQAVVRVGEDVFSVFLVGSEPDELTLG